MNVTRGADGDTFVLDGEIDMSNVEDLVQAVAAEPDARTVRLDMARVTFIDSTGIRGLLRISRLLEGRELVIVSPHPRVVRVLRLIRLDEAPGFRILGPEEPSEADQRDSS